MPEKALEIAMQYATGHVLPIESKNISIEWYNTPWNRWIPQHSTSEYDLARLKKLKGLEYYVVEFSPHDQ